MKNWEMPEIKELSISETANGIWDVGVETWVLFNDRNERRHSTTPSDNSTEEVENKNS